MQSSLTKVVNLVPHGRDLAQPDWDRRHRAILVVQGATC